MEGTACVAVLRSRRTRHVQGAVRRPVWLEWSGQAGEIRAVHRGQITWSPVGCLMASRCDPESSGSHSKVVSQEGISSDTYNDVI